ncbi:hypothetical protein LCGC14_2923050, partial [marine sediment metagenome]
FIDFRHEMTERELLKRIIRGTQSILIVVVAITRPTLPNINTSPINQYT